MKYLLRIISVAFCLAYTFACTEESLNVISTEQFVIEAFLFAGEPIDDIKIKSTFPLTDIEDTSTPINDAEVVLIKDGNRYNLQSLNDEGFYFYPGSDLKVEEADIFNLEVMYNGILATAETIVPAPTTGLQLSRDEVIIPRIGLGGLTDPDVIRPIIEAAGIEIQWDANDDDLFYAVIQTIDEELDPIFPQMVAERLSQFRFVSEPTRDNSIFFLGVQIESYGIHSVKVYRINDEYAALFESQEQDSRDLNEPPTNIKNALGVFSAFNSQEAFFEVRRN